MFTPIEPFVISELGLVVDLGFFRLASFNAVPSCDLPGACFWQLRLPGGIVLDKLGQSLDSPLRSES